MRKRSKYKPKYERGTIPVTIRHDCDNDLMIGPHEALATYSCEGDWHTLASRLNWGAVAAQRFDGASARLEAARAVVAGLRGAVPYSLTAEQRQVLGDALELCDALQLSMTRREIRDDLQTMLAINETLRK